MESFDLLVKKYKKFGTAQIIAQLSKAKDDVRLACIDVLKQRGQDVSQYEDSTDVREEAIDTSSVEVTTKENLKIEESVGKIKKSEHISLKRRITEQSVSSAGGFSTEDIVTFVVAKNSKRAAGEKRSGKVINIKVDDANKVWLKISVENEGLFLKKSTACSK